MFTTLMNWFRSLFRPTTEITPVTPCSDYEEPQSVYTVIEQSAIETADADVLSWEQSLRRKYGISNTMVAE